jgi:hypothetical protein
VRPGEILERPAAEAAVCLVHAGQRRASRMMVIEQGVIEVEKDKSRAVSGAHTFIIRTSRMVN